MRPIPLPDLERLIALPKYLADPARDLADLRRRPRAERDDWWRALQESRRGYHALLPGHGPDQYLECYLCLAEVKLVATSRDLGEPEPQGSQYPEAAYRSLERLEELSALDRLKPEDLLRDMGQAQGGDASRGAHLAATLGLHLTTAVVADPSIPGPLAFAFHRLYRRRLARAQEFARLYVEKYGVSSLVRDIQWTCGGCQRLTLDADHVRALSQASVEVLIALAPPEQARMVAELARLKVMQGMSRDQVLAVLAKDQPRALEALKELAVGAAASGQLEVYERLVQELKGNIASQQRDYQFTLNKFESVVDKSMGAIKEVAWAAGPEGTHACSACGAQPS